MPHLPARSVPVWAEMVLATGPRRAGRTWSHEGLQKARTRNLIKVKREETTLPTLYQCGERCFLTFDFYETTSSGLLQALDPQSGAKCVSGP